jgi:hypothetical protein
MQRVVARQSHQLRCQQELIESYERLSRKTLKVLQGLGDSDTGVARERTLSELVAEVGSGGVLGTLHQRLSTLESIVLQGQAETPTAADSGLTMRDIERVLSRSSNPDWIGRIARWIYSTVTRESTDYVEWLQDHIPLKWLWREYSNGDQITGTKCNTYTMYAYTPRGGGETVWIEMQNEITRSNLTNRYEWKIEVPKQDTVTSWGYSEAHKLQEIAQTPECEYAECVIIHFPQAAGYNGHWSERILFPFDTEYQIACIPPIADTIRSVVPGEGRTEYAEVMNAIPWRALVGTYGTYTAPADPE